MAGGGRHGEEGGAPYLAEQRREGSGVWEKGEGWAAIYRQEALDMSTICSRWQ
jgi:hypothetical protein